MNAHVQFDGQFDSVVSCILILAQDVVLGQCHHITMEALSISFLNDFSNQLL